MVKKFVLMAVACACVGSYTVAGAQGTLDVKPDPAKPVVAEQAAPMVGMPSPIHEFATIDEAAKYMNIMPPDFIVFNAFNYNFIFIYFFLSFISLYI